MNEDDLGLALGLDKLKSIKDNLLIYDVKGTTGLNGSGVRAALKFFENHSK